MVITLLYIHVHHWWLYININLSHHIWLLFYPHLCWFYHDLFPWFIHLLKDFVARTDSGKSPSKQFAWATGRWTAARAAAAASSTLEPPGRMVDVAWYGGPMHLSWGFSTWITMKKIMSHWWYLNCTREIQQPNGLFLWANCEWLPSLCIQKRTWCAVGNFWTPKLRGGAP